MFKTILINTTGIHLKFLIINIFLVKQNYGNGMPLTQLIPWLKTVIML